MLVFCGTLLEQAEELLRMGLSPAEVIEGYQMASKKALEILPSKDAVEFLLGQLSILRTQCKDKKME